MEEEDEEYGEGKYSVLELDGFGHGDTSGISNFDSGLGSEGCRGDGSGSGSGYGYGMSCGNGN